MKAIAAHLVERRAGSAPHTASGMPHSRYCALLCVLLLAIAGCIPVPRGGDGTDMRFMSSDELREYAEEVFRHQNRVTTRLMMAPLDAPSIGEDDRRRIEQAETRMNNACASLNEIASARSSGEDVDRKLENTVRKQVRTCARETGRLEDLLDALDIGAQRHETSGRRTSGQESADQRTSG